MYFRKIYGKSTVKFLKVKTKTILMNKKAKLDPLRIVIAALLIVLLLWFIKMLWKTLWKPGSKYSTGSSSFLALGLSLKHFEKF